MAFAKSSETTIASARLDTLLDQVTEEETELTIKTVSDQGELIVEEVELLISPHGVFESATSEKA